MATKDEIDDINIHHATLLSMKRAIDNLSIIPDKIYFDGLYVPDSNIESHAIVKGDSKIREISAASIIAKVARDNEMTHLNKIFSIRSVHGILSLIMANKKLQMSSKYHSIRVRPL